MTLQIGRFQQATPAPYLAPAATADVAPGPPQALRHVVVHPPIAAPEDEGTIVGDVPPAPTPEAREMVDRAAERVQELLDRNRELHFSRDEASNRIVIQVRDLDGNVIKTIPPSSALDILSGEPL